MVFKINGRTIGGIRAKSQSGGNAVVRPQLPGHYLEPAYFIAKSHTELSLEIVVDNYELVLQTLIDLLNNGDGVYYLSDDATPLIENQYGVWAIIESYEGACSVSNPVGSLSIRCVVTTNHEDSSYAP